MVRQRERRSAVGAPPNRDRPLHFDVTRPPGNGLVGGRSPICGALFLLATLLHVGPADTAHATERTEPVVLEVNGEGVAVAKAILLLPGSSELARRLLTDASNWPGLFFSPVRVRPVIRHQDRAVTDMYLSPPWPLGELHMVVETREISPLRLETRLLRGDVRQYSHVWQLTPLAGERCTRAVLELTMQLQTWMPSWLFRWLVRQELDGHLERVVVEAGRRAGDAGACFSGEPVARPSG